eukprot:TRINITY_DN2978_c1_g1_i1.p1 TRINITY_DN2978_c1_g1~~TRINITY_DN2978_c1_g1_i1.p1  ORF type:complete len:533 (+),score=168.19 TRINITY_DN2978_c1_g1_i1:82-1599(+)
MARAARPQGEQQAESGLDHVLSALREGSSGSAHSSQLNATEELLGLSHALDDHAQTLKRQVMESVSLVRASIDHRHAEEIAALQAQMDLQAARHRAEVRALNEELARRAGAVDRLDRSHKHCARNFFSRGTELRRREATRTYYMQWLGWVQRQQHRHIMQDHSYKLRRAHSLRCAFDAWRLASSKHVATQRHDRMRAQLETQMERERNDHIHEVSNLQAEIGGLRARLAEEAEHRGQLEERLKIAFMRGVCALNLEAMQVLRKADDVALSGEGPPQPAPPSNITAAFAAGLGAQRGATPDADSAAAPGASAIGSQSGPTSDDRSAEQTAMATLAAAAPPALPAVLHSDPSHVWRQPAPAAVTPQGGGARQTPLGGAGAAAPPPRRVFVSAAGAEEVVRHDKGRALVRAVPPPVSGGVSAMQAARPAYIGMQQQGPRQGRGPAGGTPARGAKAQPGQPALSERCVNPPGSASSDKEPAAGAPRRRPLAGAHSPPQLGSAQRPVFSR